MKQQPDYWQESYPDYFSSEGWELQKSIARDNEKLKLAGKLTFEQLMNMCRKCMQLTLVAIRLRDDAMKEKYDQMYERLHAFARTRI